MIVTNVINFKDAYFDFLKEYANKKPVFEKQDRK